MWCYRSGEHPGDLTRWHQRGQVPAHAWQLAPGQHAVSMFSRCWRCWPPVFTAKDVQDILCYHAFMSRLFWNSVPQCSALGGQVQRFHYCHVFLILTTSLKHLQSMIPSTEEKQRSWQRHQSWKLVSLDIGEWIALCWMFLILLTKKQRLLATFASLKKQQQPARIGWQLGALHSRLFIDRRHPFM